jgi:tryptophanase
LAVSRRVYTQIHKDYVAQSLAMIKDRAGELKGYRIKYEPELLRHFTAELEPI